MYDEVIDDDDDDYINNDDIANPRPEEFLNLSPWKKIEAVTCLSNCHVRKAKALCIYDLSNKLQQNNTYDIGGAFSDCVPEFWFFYTTSTCPGINHLMNIFVCHRCTGKFALGMSSQKNLIKNIGNTNITERDHLDLEWFQFNTIQQHTVYYIKTFRFSEIHRNSLSGHTLVIPIRIDKTISNMTKKNVVDRIKVENGRCEELSKCQPDFVVKSSSGKEYKVHKIVLAAHSPVIRNAIRDVDCNSYCINKSDYEIELLLQFLYTGIIKDILDKKIDMLLELAHDFELENLEVSVKYAVKASINASNAISLAVIAEKYNNKEIQEIAFQYVQSNPETLQSEEFSQIDNANLIKKLLNYIHAHSIASRPDKAGHK